MEAPQPTSLRDALMRVSHNTVLAKHEVRRAEDMEFGYLKGEYQELLRFESDIAQLSELILLFSESAGSLAELGAFVMDEEVAPRMLVVVDHINYKSQSFIKNGPIYSLEFAYGDEAVCVIDLTVIGGHKIDDVRAVDLEAFRRAIDSALRIRLARRSEPRTFDPSKNGHITKLITGFIQHYSSLTLDEIEVLLYCIGVPRSAIDIRRHMMCAEFYGWIEIRKRGLHTFYSAVAQRVALHFQFSSNSNKTDRRRLRADILKYWSENDLERFECITSAAARSI